MNTLTIIKKLKANDEREWFEIPAVICLNGIKLEDLANAAKEEDLVNQLGVMIDIALTYLIEQSDPKYAPLTRLRAQLFSEKKNDIRPFYCDEDSRITKLNEKRTPQIVRNWNLICPLDTDTFIRVYTQEYEDRQRKTKYYYFVANRTIL